MKHLITIFTPTYNRAHTLGRTYQSLCCQTSHNFRWLIVDDGSTDNTARMVQIWKREDKIPIDYVFKENGGLYTAYNTAYQHIYTELSACIDSDDYMPQDGVEKIIECWKCRGSDKYAGIIGLDFTPRGEAIGGFFPPDLREVFFPEVGWKYHHHGDTKLVLRTELMKQVIPQIGFPGEKNFNPIYMILKVVDCYPLLVINENLCYVDYQENDSMSRRIFKQYVDSPRSFAKLRCLEMKLKHYSLYRKFVAAAHFISSCLLAKELSLIKCTSNKLLTLIASPLGVLIYCVTRFKTRSHP